LKEGETFNVGQPIVIPLCRQTDIGLEAGCIVQGKHLSVIGHGIGGKYIPIMARLAKARRWSKR